MAYLIIEVESADADMVENGHFAMLRILDEVKHKIEQAGDAGVESCIIRDVNGNRVGHFSASFNED